MTDLTSIGECTLDVGTRMRHEASDFQSFHLLLALMAPGRWLKSPRTGHLVDTECVTRKTVNLRLRWSERLGPNSRKSLELNNRVFLKAITARRPVSRRVVAPERSDTVRVFRELQ